MTKDAYYSMCEDLGTEPDPKEVPVDFDDLPIEIQSVIFIYNKLRDDWDTMNGGYLGKKYEGILDIFSILEVPKEEHRFTFELIDMIDSHRKRALRAHAEARRQAEESEKASKKAPAH